MVLDFKDVHNFHYHVVSRVKILCFFGTKNSLSVNAENRNKDILIFGELPKDRLDDTTVTAGTKYSVITSNHKNKICLSLHYNSVNRFLHANGVKSKGF